MSGPPGTIPPARATRPQPHPRRPPAHESVSLRRSPPAEASAKSSRVRHSRNSLSSQNPPASDQANPPSSASPTAIITKQSSGESSDAGRWFDNTNNNAVQNRASPQDNEPPFFLRNSSSSSTPPEGHNATSYIRHPSAAMPYRPAGMAPQLGTEGSSTEEYRSVIDDLTVANKKLKQKLRKYEKMYDAHLDDEKLFEVKFHGLPEHKKVELEDTLRKFAANLDSKPDTPAATYPPNFNPQMTTSSLTSNFAESGYASMSASGPNSSSVNTASGQNSNRKMSKAQYSRQQQSIQSYLQDIPAGLLPVQNAPMSEKAKKKMVVRRLEQLFAGKHSTPGSHSQPMQQEEVAQSAAMADRREKEATGQSSRKEGHREARIMRVRAEDDDGFSVAPQESLQKFPPHLAINEHDFAGSLSPDQRPTRPLDLDPYRAQVPVENMQYFRHLGFSPPDMESEESPQDGHGWIYLNLLINMAQLHTINVTPEFVKAAVTEYSSKFELSPEGRKIRWKGGHDLTRNSDSSSENLSGASPYGNQSGCNSKSPFNRIKSGNSGDSGDSNSCDQDRDARKAAYADREKEHDKFAYQPIFFHKDDSGNEDDYEFDPSSSNSTFMAHPGGDSSGFNSSSAMRSSSSHRRNRNGPMIFYNKAKFCTDLSGDPKGLSTVDPSTYKSLSVAPLGAPPVARFPEPRSTNSIGESRGPLDAMPTETDSRDSDSMMSSGGDFGFSPATLQGDVGDSSPDVMNFEASGLGGVRPTDNFSIQVRRSQTKVEPRALSRSRNKHSRHYSKKILEVLHEQRSSGESEGSHSPEHVVKEEIVSASRKDLASSELPPASFLPFDSTSSGDVDSDVESYVSSDPSARSSDRNPRLAPVLRNQQSSTAYMPNTSVQSNLTDAGEESSSDDDEDDDDESVDLLATARQQNPNAVRISEREYDAQFADRLADEIPAGSSAATAGGGSGFNSPVSRAGKPGEEGGDGLGRARRASASTSSPTNRLKRARTGDSTTTTLHVEKMRRQS